MSMIDIDPATYTVPEDTLLLFLDGSVLKKKDHAGTVSTATEGDLFYLDITTSDLPCLVSQADYDTAHNKGDVPQNLDKSSAIAQSAAVKLVQNVSDQKVNNVKFTTFMNVLDDKVTTHTGNTTIHVTSDDKTNWNAKATTSDVATAKSEAITEAGNLDTALHTTITGEVATAKSEAISAAATDATTKSATAKSEAITEAGNLDTALHSMITGEIDTAKGEAIASAGTDASAKDEVLHTTVTGEIATAKSEAISAAATDASTKSATAKSEAIAEAKAAGDLAYAGKTATEAHIADGDIHVTAEQKTNWTAKLDKAETSTENNIVTFGANGIIKDSTASIGGENLEATPTASKVATELAVKNLGDTKLNLDGTNALAGTLFLSEKTTPATGAKDKPKHKLKISSNPAGNGIVSFDYTNESDVTVSTILELGSSSDYIVLKSVADASYAPLSHTHAIADVTNLQTTLDAKATPADITTALGPYSTTEQMNTAINTAVSAVLRWKGTCTYSELQAKTDMKQGDTWCVTDKENWEYAYTGTAWEPIGPNVDYSVFAIKTDVATDIAAAKSEAISAAATDATTKANAAQSAAETTAAADATTKANTAKSEAITEAGNLDTTLHTTITGEIATAKSEAISEAASDATTKAGTAKSEAIAAAATDAASKDETLHTTVTGEIATAKSEAISTAATNAAAAHPAIADYNAHVAATDIHHTHSNKSTLDGLSLSGLKLQSSGVNVQADIAVDDTCVALSDLTNVFGRNNVAGGFPMEIVGYNVLGEHRYAWSNGTTTIYTTKIDTSSYTQFYLVTGTTSVAGKGKGTKNSTLSEPSLYAWTATGNITTGSIAYAYRNADSGVIYYCNTSAASTSTNMYTNHAYSGTAVKPTAASGSPRVVTIDGVQYTYTATYNKVTVYTETPQPSKTATGTDLYYYTTTYNTSGSTLNATTIVIAEDFSQMTISSNVYTRDTTKDYEGRGEFARAEASDYAGSSIVRVVPIGGALRSDDRFKSIYYKNASDVMTDCNSSLVTYMKKGVFGLVTNSNLTGYLSYAFRNADSGKVYYTSTTTPTTSTAMYLDYGLTGTSVKPTAYTTTSPRTVTIDSVVYTYDANYNQFTTSKFINCTKDLWTLIEKALTLGSAAYVRLYQLDAPQKSGWIEAAQNWWKGTCLYNTAYSTFYSWAAANDGQPKDGSGQWKLYYKLGETEQYVLMTSAPSADNNNKSRPTEQKAWFDIYTQAGGVLITEEEQKGRDLYFSDGTQLKCIAEAVVPVNGVYRDVQKSVGTVLITAAQCEAGLYMKEDNKLRKVTKYDQKEIFETALFDDGEIYIHPTMNSSYGLANLKFTFNKANVVGSYEAPSTTNDTEGEDPAMISAVILLNSDIIDPNNIDTILTLDPGSMSDPAMAAVVSPKRGYTSFVDGEYNTGLGYNCMVTGNSNEVYGDWSVVSGLHNLVAGMMSSASGNDNIVFADSASALGGSNKIYGSANFGTGVANMMYGYDGVAVGARNQTFGVNNLAVGFSNEIYAGSSIAVGTRNRAYEKGNNSILVGMNLKNYAPKAMVLGAYGVVNAVDGTRPEDTSVTIQMPIYGLPIQLNKNNISTYVGQTLYMTNSTLATGTYTQTTITTSHVGRWVILPSSADTTGIDNKNGAFLCMGDYEKNDEDALCIMGYTKYRWTVNDAYFAATPGTTGRSGLEPYICEPFHQWNFTGVMSMKFTEATALDSKYESWDLTVRDGGRVKTFDPGKVQEDAEATNYYVDFNQATRWKIKEGTNLVLFPRNFVDGAEAYVVIYAGKTVSWTGFTNGEDTGTGANTFDSLVWVGGSAPTTTGFTTGFALVKLMVVDNVCVAETIASTLA